MRPQGSRRRPSRRSSVLPLIAAGALLWAAPTSPTAAAARPNIVVILVDDLGYGDLSSYGGTDVRTPAVDALVAGGMRVDPFYANCPVCSPTRAALLAGRYPELVGVPGVVRTRPEDNWGFLAPGAVLLPEILRAAGYHTALVGKWHLGLSSPNVPNDRGFDHFHGFLGDMMDDYYKHRRHGINYMRRDREEIDPEGHATDLFTDWAVDYLGGRARARAGAEGRPFFLYLAYNAPHTPIQPPEDWLEKVVEREQARGNAISPKRAKLVALIEHMDAGIGRVMAALKDTGLAADTLVVFTSDNGGQVNVGGTNGPLRGGKQDMYEGGIRVPFAAVWPGVIAPGSRGSVTALTMDLFPTLAEAAGATFEQDVDGRSFLATLKGEVPKLPPRDLFWTRREGNLRYMGECTWAMRRGDWKLVKNSPFEPWELYHLGRDPAEQKDLVASERKTFNNLAAAMRAHIQRGGAVPWQKKVPSERAR